jgi:hypothetical protein
MNQDSRDSLLDEALRALPVPRAPRTLLPKLLAATSEQVARPWYSRAWLTWPPAWQAASLMLVVLMIAGAAIGRLYLGAAIGIAAESAGPAGLQFMALMNGLEAVPAIARVLLRSIEPIAIAGGALAALFMLTGAACWRAITRLAIPSEDPVHP